MSLADLVPLVLECDLKPRRLSGKESRAAKARRWKAKNRAHLRAYKRAWRAQRRAAGVVPT